MEDEALLKRITLNPKVMAGKPVIKDTRLTVEFIVSLMAHGATAAEIIDEYKGLTIEDIQACVKQLGATLAALQQLDSGTQSTGELTRLREELDQSLEIAGRVESRLNSLLDRTESDIDSSRSRVGGNNQKGN